MKPSSLGDIIHTLPAVAVIKRRFPDAKLHWVANTEWAPLLAGNSDLQSIIEFPRKQWRGWRDLGKARQWARENLGDLNPDITVDFQGLLRSGLLTKVSQANLKVGFRQAREGARFFYDTAIDVKSWKEKHAVDRYLELVGGLNQAEVDFKLPSGDAINDVEAAGAVVLHPFSRGEGKSLSFAEVIDFCEAVGQQQRVILVGAGVEWPETLPFPKNAINLVGKTTLTELIWLIRSSAFFVSVDSGPMHLAAGITNQLLSIHTWTDPMMVGPYQKEALIYRNQQIVPMDRVEQGQFPEDRGRKKEFSEKRHLLPNGAMKLIADSVLKRLTP